VTNVVDGEVKCPDCGTEFWVDSPVDPSLRNLSMAVLVVMQASGLGLEDPTGSYARCVLLKYGFDAATLRKLAGEP